MAASYAIWGKVPSNSVVYYDLQRLPRGVPIPAGSTFDLWVHYQPNQAAQAAGAVGEQNFLLRGIPADTTRAAITAMVAAAKAKQLADAAWTGSEPAARVIWEEAAAAGDEDEDVWW